MLASHAALCSSTGSLEMLVFHTLLAGNMGQFGAPGTTVAVTGAVVTCSAGPTVARSVSVHAGGGCGSATGDEGRCGRDRDHAAAYLTPHDMSVSRRTVTSWHGPPRH